MLLADDLNQILQILPDFIRKPLGKHPKHESLIEIVLDLGRRPEVRFANETEYLSYRIIVWQDLDHIIKKLGKFSGDNRAGIERTLHRISSIRNRQGSIIGLTCRIGRAVFGTVSVIRDLLEKQKSILILGRPGVGKTTSIREIARVLSDEMGKRVIIIDTSNEIAGDGDLPHPSIGKSRRMQVASPQNQHQVMIEAVENHMPEIIIIDEIGTELEAAAARTIAERGVQLVGTAHGNALENLIKNPVITDLVGGIQYVTLGDEEAKRRGTSKSILERKAPSTFEIALEIHDPETWIIHDNVDQSVDSLLRNQNPFVQNRKITKQGRMLNCGVSGEQNSIDTIGYENTSRKNSVVRKNNNRLIQKTAKATIQKSKKVTKNNLYQKPSENSNFLFLYIYGVNSRDLASIIKTLNLPIIITKEIQHAHAILALTNLMKNNKRLKQIAHSCKINIYTIQNTNLLKITKALRQLLDGVNISISNGKKENIKNISKIIEKSLLTPLEEARIVIEELIIPQKLTLDLLPQNSQIRKLQHEIINHYRLKGISIGDGKNRRVRIYSN